MNYAAIRDEVQSGDIIALSHKDWSSWYDIQIQAVRIFTQSEYSHVGVIWRYAGRVFVIESVQPFVRIVPLSNLADKGFYHIPIGVEPNEQEVEFQMGAIGVFPYSKIQAVLAYLGRLKLGADTTYECAEFAIVARSKSGVDLGDKATPSAVVQHLLEAGYHLNYVKR